MKKVLLSMVAVLFSLGMMAQTTVEFVAGTDVSPNSSAVDNDVVTKDGISITVSNGVLGRTDNYRCYKGKTLTVSSTIGEITSVEFTCTANDDAQYGPGCFTDPTTGSYSYEGKIGTWTGSASEFTLTASSAQVRATKIVVTVGGEGPVGPVIGTPSFSLESGSYNGAQELTITAAEGYGLIYTLDGSTPEDGVGTYEKSGKATISVKETTTVKAISVDNSDPDNASSVKTVNITIVNEYNTAATALTVSEALKFIEAGENLDMLVYTKGEISEITEVSTSYGNATYTITDGTSSLVVFRGYGLDNAKFKAENDIMVGDKVVVVGKLINYKKDETETPEYAAGNYIVSQEKVERPTNPGSDDNPEDYKLVGAGTLDNPYTIADVQKGIYKDGESVKGVWVKGTILGCVNTSTGALETEEGKEYVASNLCLGTEDGTLVIPVQLIAKTDARTILNLLDNPSNLNKEVWLFGDVEKYCKVAGLKNVSNWSWDGSENAIESIIANEKNGAIFNLAGQRISAPQKGINIIGGKKVLVK